MDKNKKNNANSVLEVINLMNTVQNNSNKEDFLETLFSKDKKKETTEKKDIEIDIALDDEVSKKPAVSRASRTKNKIPTVKNISINESLLEDMNVLNVNRKEASKDKSFNIDVEIDNDISIKEVKELLPKKKTKVDKTETLLKNADSGILASEEATKAFIFSTEEPVSTKKDIIVQEDKTEIIETDTEIFLNSTPVEKTEEIKEIKTETIVAEEIVEKNETDELCTVDREVIDSIIESTNQNFVVPVVEEKEQVFAGKYKNAQPDIKQDFIYVSEERTINESAVEEVNFIKANLDDIKVKAKNLKNHLDKNQILSEKIDNFYLVLTDNQIELAMLSDCQKDIISPQLCSLFKTFYDLSNYYFTNAKEMNIDYSLKFLNKLHSLNNKLNLAIIDSKIDNEKLREYREMDSLLDASIEIIEKTDFSQKN